jgi:hypothetical protein
MVLILIILFGILNICAIMFCCVKITQLRGSVDRSVSGVQDALGQVFNLVGALGEENVQHRKMIDTVINLIRETKATVQKDGISYVRTIDSKGNPVFVEEDRDF